MMEGFTFWQSPVSGPQPGPKSRRVVLLHQVRPCVAFCHLQKQLTDLRHWPAIISARSDPSCRFSVVHGSWTFEALVI